MKAAAKLIAEASRPILVAGGGAKASGAGPEIVQLAEMLSIPVVTSLSGKGVMLENHPLCVGVVGSYSRSCANRLVSESDLVVYIGSQTGDQVTNGWKVPKPGTSVIQIDIDPAELGRSYPNSVGIAGDAKLALQALLKQFDSKIKKGKWGQHAMKVVAEWWKEYDPLCDSSAIPIRPERLCRELTTNLPPDAILVADTGYSGIWTGALVPMTHPGQTYLRAAGSLGPGLPRLPGGKMRGPEKTGRLLHRRRRFLVSSVRARNRCPLRHQYGNGRQQQLRPRAVRSPRERRLCGPEGEPGCALPIPPVQLCHAGAGYGVPRHQG